jgi:hypothetical protein
LVRHAGPSAVEIPIAGRVAYYRSTRALDRPGHIATYPYPRLHGGSFRDLYRIESRREQSSVIFHSVCQASKVSSPSRAGRENTVCIKSHSGSIHVRYDEQPFQPEIYVIATAGSTYYIAAWNTLPGLEEIRREVSVVTR